MSCERPYALIGILILIPILLFLFFHKKEADITVDAELAAHNRKSGKRRLFDYSRLSKVKILLFGLAWCMLVLAYSKIYWGTNLVPVQKNGTSVCFVFDISNSMLANDGPQNTTRLKAATVYAKKLMEKMDSTPISVVLAKGDGIIAIPITEDYVMIDTLLEVMSPSLMTAPGTSLGKGILKARDSFPANYSNAGRIWVFTDGEETDCYLKNSLLECVKSGIPVSIVGFGQETEIEITAGDGKTKVKSALRSNKVRETIEAVQKNMSFYKNQTQLLYINSLERGSALTLLSQLKYSDNQIVSYEAKPIPRYKFFLAIGILLFAAGFIITEFDLTKLFPELKKTSTMALLFTILLLFVSCSSDTVKVLEGAYSCNQKQYSHAISLFYNVSESAAQENNREVLDFALYDLGTVYSLLDENQAALEKYNQVDINSNERVVFAAYYNAGVIYHKKGEYDKAIEYFKKALQIDSTNLEAKINLELSIQQADVEVNNKQSDVIPAQEEQSSSQDMEKSVFQRIKENDQKQWKSSEPNQDQNLAGDY